MFKKSSRPSQRIRTGLAGRRRGRAVVVAGSVVLVALFSSALPASARSLPVWTVAQSPDPGAAGNSLRSVSCASPTDCVAVGYESPGVGLGEQPLVESWDGTTWSILATPSIGSSAQLNGVSCPTSTFCVAVGLVFSSSGNQALIETFDGTSWTIEQASGTSGDLHGVSCPSTTSCVAVGEAGNILIESWNGATWTTSTGVNVSTQSNVLQAVSCPTATDCVAAGYEVNSQNQEQTLVESFDGSSWTADTTPDQTTFNNVLSGISCTSASSCVAVGTFDPGNYNDQILTEVFDGSAWSIVKSPAPSKLVDGLSGVSCTSASSCLAVGAFEITPSQTQTLVESFNGKRWLVDPSQDPGSVSNGLNAVVSTSANAAIAVGSFANPSSPFAVSQTLVEASAPAPPSLNEVTPAAGAPGQKVTITGANLTGATAVSFNGVPATIHSDTERTIKAIVPATATTGPITVTTAGGSATTTGAFTVT